MNSLSLWWGHHDFFKPTELLQGTLLCCYTGVYQTESINLPGKFFFLFFCFSKYGSVYYDPSKGCQTWKYWRQTLDTLEECFLSKSQTGRPKAFSYLSHSFDVIVSFLFKKKTFCRVRFSIPPSFQSASWSHRTTHIEELMDVNSNTNHF